MNVCGWLGLRRLLYNIIYINEEEREEKYADYDNNLRIFVLFPLRLYK